MELMDYLENAQSSLFRWEALQNYEVGDESDMTEWWNFIEKKTNQVVIMQRVRLVTVPLTEYTQKEIETHKLSVQKGDVIRYILDTGKEDIKTRPDFWLIDDRVVLEMKYGPNGEYHGFKVIEGKIQEYLDFAKKLYAAAEPIQGLEIQKFQLRPRRP